VTLTLARGPRRGDVFELTVDRIGERGEGVGALPAVIGPDRQARTYSVHVRHALPGEVVRFEVVRRRRKQLEGRLVQVVAPAEARIEPRCTHFGSPREPGKGCGGCALQHLDHAAQRRAKGQRIGRLLTNAGLDVAVLAEPLAAAPTWYYRNKMELSFGNDAERRFSLGMHPAGFRYETLDLRQCHLMSPFASAFAPEIGRWARESGLDAYDARHGTGCLRTLTLREGKRTGERMVVVQTELGHAPEGFGPAFAAAALAAADRVDGRIDAIWWIERHAARGKKTELIEHHLHGAETFAEELHLPGDRTLRFAIGPQAFFQPSTAGAEAIYAEVLSQLELADSRRGTIVDLYCGTGTIGLFLSPFAGRVIGIELNAEAVGNARANAEANAITNAEFIAGDAAKVLAERATELADIGAVVVDPPRSGLSAAALEQVASLAAPRLCYVACRPESLARDAALLRRHGYKLRKVQPVDQFPHTGHIECVALLTRDDEAATSSGDPR